MAQIDLDLELLDTSDPNGVTRIVRSFSHSVNMGHRA